MIPKQFAMKWHKKTEGKPVLRLLLRMGLELPVVGLWLMLITCWHFYCIAICLIASDNLAQKVVYITVYNVLVGLSASCLLRTMYTPSPVFPSAWHLSQKQVDALDKLATVAEKNKVLEELVRERNLPVHTRNTLKSVAFCAHCKIIKPDRTHHCKRCRKCRPRYDHHCPWLNKCIHHGNHKFFVLMLIYTILFGVWQVSTSIEFLVRWATGTEHHYGHTDWLWNVRIGAMYLLLLTIIFSLAIGNLLVFHIRITMENETTVDQIEIDDLVKTPDWKPGQIVNFRYPTLRRNIETIFGNKLWQWPLPIHTPTEGPYEYQVYVNGLVYQGQGHSNSTTDTSSIDIKMDDVDMPEPDHDGTAKSESTSAVTDTESSTTNHLIYNKTKDLIEPPAQSKITSEPRCIGADKHETDLNKDVAGKSRLRPHLSHSADGDNTQSDLK